MRILLALLLLAPASAWASSYTITNSFTGGTTAVASEVNANFTGAKTAIDDNDSRLDALLTDDTCVVAPCSLTAATTLGGVEIVLDSDIGTTVQAYDADLADLADGSLSGSKIGAPGGVGVDASVITSGTMSSTARLPSVVIEESELNTTTKINDLTVDDDFITASGTYDMSVTGSAAFTGTLQGAVAVTSVSGTTATLLSTTTIGSLYYCTNAAGCDITLPTAAAGLNACFYDGNGGGVVVLDAATGDKICLDGVCPVGTAEAIDSAGNIGDFVCILAVDSTNWVTLGRSGTWVTGGAD